MRMEAFNVRRRLALGRTHASFWSFQEPCCGDCGLEKTYEQLGLKAKQRTMESRILLMEFKSSYT
jgi:hypothetical protein